jgi:hypothetical protein
MCAAIESKLRNSLYQRDMWRLKQRGIHRVKHAEADIKQTTMPLRVSVGTSDSLCSTISTLQIRSSSRSCRRLNLKNFWARSTTIHTASFVPTEASILSPFWQTPNQKRLLGLIDNRSCNTVVQASLRVRPSVTVDPDFRLLRQTAQRERAKVSLVTNLAILLCRFPPKA